MRVAVRGRPGRAFSAPASVVSISGYKLSSQPCVTSETSISIVKEEESCKLSTGGHGRRRRPGVLDCCCGCCLVCCSCAVAALCNWFSFLVMVAAAGVLIAAFGVALPVRARVADASLARLDLFITTTNGTANATTTNDAVSVAYNISLAVHLRNRNWAMRIELAAPLDAELRFAGRRFDGARLADVGRSVPPRGTEEFRVLAASPGPGGVALGGADAAAELARERAEGVFEVELRIVGNVRYRPVHAGRSRRLEATCPLKLLVPNAPPGTHLVVVQKAVSCY